MSGLSLRAACSDGFRYPPDFDPKKHKSLAGYTGQHPLRERARKLDQGILIVRYEVPYHIWCDGCGAHIGQGVRFNAEKKQVGMYLSTKVWSFSMRHHCGNTIEIRTNPEQCSYDIERGARKKVVGGYDDREQGVMELNPEGHKEAMMDPLYALEHRTEGKRRADAGKEEVKALRVRSDAIRQDDYARNAELRRRHRPERDRAKKADERRRALGLPEGVRLAADTPEDALEAATTSFGAEGHYRRNAASRRSSILSQGIFGEGGSGAAASKLAGAGHPGPHVPARATLKGGVRKGAVKKRPNTKDKAALAARAALMGATLRPL